PTLRAELGGELFDPRAALLLRLHRLDRGRPSSCLRSLALFALRSQPCALAFDLGVPLGLLHPQLVRPRLDLFPRQHPDGFCHFVLLASAGAGARFSRCARSSIDTMAAIGRPRRVTMTRSPAKKTRPRRSENPR